VGREQGGCGTGGRGTCFAGQERLLWLEWPPNLTCLLSQFNLLQEIHPKGHCVRP
jgi:hypothetical protein